MALSAAEAGLCVAIADMVRGQQAIEEGRVRLRRRRQGRLAEDWIAGEIADTSSLKQIRRDSLIGRERSRVDHRIAGRRV